MAPTAFLTAFDLIIDEGYFKSVIEALEGLPNSRSAGCANLATKMTVYANMWDAWHTLVENDQNSFLYPAKWKGQASLSHKSLTQTVVELCNALEKCKNARQKNLE